MKQIGAFGVALLIATVMPATAAATFTQTVHQDAGARDDFYLYAQFHITVNASGLPTALIDNLTVTCR
jgi:Mn2+/Fe2+ NRAMP family transporter